MKYCQSRDCPYALRHRESQEYRDEAVACADCGAELVSERPDWAAARASEPGWPWIGIVLSVLVPLAIVWLEPRILLPRLDISGLRARMGELTQRLHLSVLALGLNPVISASLLVELAALVVPPWRPLRVGGPAGRARLQAATGWLALGLALVQGLGMAVYLERMDALQADARLSRLIVVFSLVGGTFFLLAAARFLDVAALGGGFSLLLTAFAMASATPLATAILGRFAEGDPGGAAAAATAALLLSVAGTVFVLHRPRGGEAGRLPLPACGLIPVPWGMAIAGFGLVAAELGVWPEALGAIADPHEPWSVGLSLAVTAGFALACCFLFNRPSKLAAFGPDASSRLRRAIAPSTAYVLAIATLGIVVSRQLAQDVFSLLPLIAATAVVLDVLSESAAIRRHGPLAPVWPEHRLYAVAAAQAALERAGIASVARSAHQRVLWHFFAPFIPIQILVPRERAEEAGRLLEDYFRPMAAEGASSST